MLRRSALIPYPSKKDGQVSFADAKVRISPELTKPLASFFYLFTTFREYTLYIIIYIITFILSWHVFFLPSAEGSGCGATRQWLQGYKAVVAGPQGSGCRATRQWLQGYKAVAVGRTGCRGLLPSLWVPFLGGRGRLAENSIYTHARNARGKGRTSGLRATRHAEADARLYGESLDFFREGFERMCFLPLVHDRPHELTVTVCR